MSFFRRMLTEYMCSLSLEGENTETDETETTAEQSSEEGESE